jgi:exodeoxyribonuclease VII large subunit
MQAPLSLWQLNAMVKQLFTTLPSHVWVIAEISDLKVQGGAGHCYIDLIEKDADDRTIAAARAAIWANYYQSIRYRFEDVTHKPLAKGMRVCLKVKPTFHEHYGYSLTVSDIDPAYTIGDEALKRAKIIEQLKENGLFDLNRQLPLPQPLRSLAVISSATAAGYEDFCAQLLNNSAGYAFSFKLFEAAMQGEQTEESIIEALEHINQQLEDFDAVLIIRGGGAKADLGSFDKYNLAECCAQFPLPIITGIGHQRDETVIDLVAHTSLKTPTAVAQFIIEQNDQLYNQLLVLQQSITSLSQQKLLRAQAGIVALSTRITARVQEKLSASSHKTVFLETNLKAATQGFLARRKHHLQLATQFVELNSPLNILKRGYTITTCGGKTVRNISQLARGAQIVTRFHDGSAESTVESVEKA